MSATRIDDIENCEMKGEGVKRLGFYQKTVQRGETVEFRLPWSGTYEKRLVLTRIPTISEMADIEGSIDAFCTDSR